MALLASFSESMMTRYLWKLQEQGWGALNQFPLLRYVTNILALWKRTSTIEYLVYIWQVLLQLSCGDTCQIWIRFEESFMHFCHIENFSYGEINKQNFSNPILDLNECLEKIQRFNNKIQIKSFVYNNSRHFHPEFNMLTHWGMDKIANIL